MRQLRILRHRLQSLLRPSRAEADLQREIDVHLHQLTREYMAAGLPEPEARLAARRKFGAAGLTADQCRDTRRVSLLRDLIQDCLYALRLFRKSPGFTATAIVSLALGIGANTAIFQLFDAVLLRSLPVPHPDELVAIRIVGEGRQGNFRGRNGQITNAIWEEFQRRQKIFAGVLAFGDTPVNLAASGEVRTAEGIWVSGTFFSTLGVRAEVGRLLSPEDDRRGCGYPGVVISHAFWQREFGGDPAIASKTLLVEGHSVPILGVTPPEFFGVEVGRRFEVALPVCSADQANLDNRMFWFLSVMGRLKPGTSDATARAGLAALSRGIFEATVPPFQPTQAEQFKNMRLDLEPGGRGQSTLRDAYDQPLLILLCMVVSVLLVACANLANMMLARASAREHEFAVRASLGASRGRLIRQLLSESLLLATIGGGAGALLAPLISGFTVQSLSTARDPIYLSLSGSWHVMAFTIAAGVLATVLFGMAPAIRAARADVRGATANREKFAFRRALMVCQVALCMVLLTGALLFSRSFRNLTSVNPGFRPEAVLVANTFFSASRYPVPRRIPAFEELQEKLKAIPGVSAVARAYVMPISGSGWDRPARINPLDQPRGVNLNSVSEGYFRVMNTPILAGRDFNSNDRPQSTPVAIVNQAFARMFFAGEVPVGKTVRLAGPEPPFEIVGLVGNTKYRTMQEDFTPVVYLAASQEVNPRLTVRYHLRAGGRPESFIQPVKQAIAAMDPQLSVRFVVLKTQIEESLLRERLMAGLGGAFGVLAAMLALMGVYGVTVYIVERRQREFGIRIALGASRTGILRMVLGDVALMLAIGTIVGTAIALATGRFAAKLLYGVKPQDATTLLFALFLLAAAGLTAGLIPALRASRVAPIEALRE